MTAPQRVVVTWVDAISGAGWYDLKDAAEAQPAEVTTLGFLVMRDDERLVVAQSVSEDQALGYTVIPTGWVEKVEFI